MTVPVGFYESYRAELQSIARGLKVRRFRTLDEPVAAALGYGVNPARDETLLVVDFGGGTLDLAAVRLGPGDGRSRGRRRCSPSTWSPWAGTTWTAGCWSTSCWTCPTCRSGSTTPAGR